MCLCVCVCVCVCVYVFVCVCVCVCVVFVREKKVQLFNTMDVNSTNIKIWKNFRSYTAVCSKKFSTLTFPKPPSPNTQLSPCPHSRPRGSNSS